MTSTKNKKIVLFTIIILLASSFYWYEIRPMKITKFCTDKALEVALKQE